MPYYSKILIIGTGPVGYGAALGLAKAGHDVALVGPDAPPVRDGRTVALLDGSVRYLSSLDLWDRLQTEAAPLAYMRMIDDTGSLFRAPPVTFKASEVQLEAFGYNIELATLVEQLREAASHMQSIKRIDGQVIHLSTNEAGHCEATLSSGEIIRSQILIGADGKESIVRVFAGIGVKQWTYPQSALTAVFSHRRDHDDISTEFHTRQGPFTLVPLPGRRSSLVWMMDPARAKRMMSLNDREFERAVEHQAQSMLGAMTVEGPRGILPMSGLSAERYAVGHAALVGEAAHVFPPIGAQGLNLGFRDVADLVKALTAADGNQALERYHAARQADVKVRTMAVDLLNRSLLSDFLPVDLARSVGLLTISSITPLRRFMMRRGAGH